MAFDLLAVAGVDIRTQRWTTHRSRLEDLAQLAVDLRDSGGVTETVSIVIEFASANAPSACWACTARGSTGSTPTTEALAPPRPSLWRD
jgi:hypothetical protein